MAFRAVWSRADGILTVQGRVKPEAGIFASTAPLRALRAMQIMVGQTRKGFNRPRRQNRLVVQLIARCTPNGSGEPLWWRRIVGPN